MVRILFKKQKIPYSHLTLLISFLGMVLSLYGLVFYKISPKIFLDSYSRPLRMANSRTSAPTAPLCKIQVKDLLKDEGVQFSFFQSSKDAYKYQAFMPWDFQKYSSFIEDQDLNIPRELPVRFSADLNLNRVLHINHRKELFVSNLLPSILAYNEEIQADRNYLMILKKIKDSGQYLTAQQVTWLNKLAVKYKLRSLNMAELLKRVDIIPPSLALGQAVMETGWGCSPAAQGFNSPFGMMKTRKHVFSYSSLQESVKHYIDNLNTHEAYATMRNRRATLRSLKENLCSLKLAEGLTKYSILGRKYILRVQNIITSFNLQKYDKAHLAPFSQSS